VNNPVYLVITIMLVIGGYQQARQHERKHGYIPWNLPAWTWSILWGLGLLIGAILWVIATRTTKSPLLSGVEVQGGPGGPSAALPQHPRAQFGIIGTQDTMNPALEPQRPRSANEDFFAATVTPALAETRPSAAAAPPQATPPAGWYGDPQGSGHRYWSGTAWTEHTAP
jgi:hypothetical protein